MAGGPTRKRMNRSTSKPSSKIKEEASTSPQPPMPCKPTATCSQVNGFVDLSFDHDTVPAPSATCMTACSTNSCKVQNAPGPAKPQTAPRIDSPQHARANTAASPCSMRKMETQTASSCGSSCKKRNSTALDHSIETLFPCPSQSKSKQHTPPPATTTENATKQCTKRAKKGPTPENTSCCKTETAIGDKCKDVLTGRCSAANDQPTGQLAALNTGFSANFLPFLDLVIPYMNFQVALAKSSEIGGQEVVNTLIAMAKTIEGLKSGGAQAKDIANGDVDVDCKTGCCAEGDSKPEVELWNGSDSDAISDFDDDEYQLNEDEPEDPEEYEEYEE